MNLLPWWSALIGLALAILLIVRKLNAPYALLLGTIVGALLGGASLPNTVNIVITGSQSVMGTIIRVLAAGVLAGVMIKSGAANRIAKTIVSKLGERLAIVSLALAAMIICAVGVFIPVAVLIVAPIALEVGQRLHISKFALFVALSGAGKAGNIISANPNTIAVATGFHVQPSSVIVASFIPALCGLCVAVLLATLLRSRGVMVTQHDVDAASDSMQVDELPSIGRALVAPVLAVVLLLLNPITSLLHIEILRQWQIDAMYILPFAAVVGLLAMGKIRHVAEYAQAGLTRMVDVVLILIGAGAIGGLITSSDLPHHIVGIITALHIPGTLLAPIAGILMAAATGSTSTGVILGNSSFGSSILSVGTPALAAAVTMQAGATVIDALPHANYFHVSGQAMQMSFIERLRMIPYEALVGFTMTVVASLMYLIL